MKKIILLTLLVVAIVCNVNAQSNIMPQRNKISNNVSSPPSITEAPFFAETKAKLLSQAVYDSALQCKIIFGAVDTNNNTIAVANYLQICWADADKLQVFVQGSKDEKQSVVETLKSIGFNPTIVATNLYQIIVLPNTREPIKQQLQKLPHVQNVGYNRYTTTDGCTWFNDPLVFANNGISNMAFITDSLDWCALNNCIKQVNLTCGNIDSVETLKAFMQPSTLANPKVAYCMFDEGADTNNTELPNMLYKYNFHINSTVVTPFNHGNATTCLAIGAANNSMGGIGVAHDYPWMNMDCGSTGGFVSMQACYKALDTMLVLVAQYPSTRFVINQSYGIQNDPTYYAKVQTLNALTTTNGAKQIFFSKSSGNSGPGTIDPCQYWTDFTMIGGTSDINGCYPLPSTATTQYVASGMWSGSSTGAGTDFCANAQAVPAMNSTNGTFSPTNGTSCAAPIASGTMMLLLSQDTSAAMTYAKMYKRLRGGAYDVCGTPVGYDTAAGWGYVRAYKSLKYAVVEDYPNTDMVDNYSIPVNCNNNSNFTLPFTPKFFNSTVASFRECLYPNGTPIPFTYNTDSSITYQVVLSTVNGFTNGSNNRITYNIIVGGCGHSFPTMPFTIQNIGGPPPPATPIIANVLNFTPPFCEYDTVKIKLLNANPTYTVSALLNGSAIVYNAVDSTITVNGGFLSPTSHLQISYTNNVNTTVLDSFFAIIPTENPSPWMYTLTAPVCKNTSRTITAGISNAGTGTYQYQWYIDTVLQVGANTNTYIYNFPSAGTHTVTFVATLTNTNGACYPTNIFTTTQTVNVQQLTGLGISMTPPLGQICAGGAALLNATGASSYAWTGGITNNVVFYPTATNTYTVTFTGSNGCTQTSTRTITVNTTPTLTITATPSNATVCSGQQVTLSATGATTYIWSGGITNNAAFTPTATTTYTVTGNNGCTATATKIVTVNASPTLTVTSVPTNATVCSGQSVLLNATGASTYNWSGGITNNTSFLPTSTATYTITGTSTNGCTKTATKTVTVNLTSSSTLNATICQGQSFLGYFTAGLHIDTFVNASGCDSIRTINLTINTLPIINITSTPVNATVCNGQSVTLNATGGISPIWSGGISNNVGFVPTATTTYTVTATGINGCTNTNTKTVTVNSLPNITINSTPTNATVCAGQSAILNATGANTYSWSGGISNNLPFTPTATTTYTVTATASNTCINTATKTVVVGANTISSVTSSICQGQNYLGYNATGIYVDTLVNTNGCDSIRILNLTVNNLPIVTISSNPINPNLCNGQSITLIGNGANTYSWSGGISNNISFIPISTNTYTITGTDANNCSNTASITISVTAYPNINIAVSPNDSICTGDNITLNATSTNASIAWSGGITNNSSFFPTATTNYTVTAISNTNSLCTSTATQQVQLISNINPIISIAPSITQGITGQPVVYTATTNVPFPYSINWFLNSNFQTTTASNTWNTNLISGINDVYATINSATQCLQPDSATSSIIKVNNITAINDIQIDGITVYPNPFRDFVTIEGLHTNDKIILFNAIGQNLIETNGKELAANKNMINMSNFSSGLYLLLITRENKVNRIELIR